MSCTLSVGKHMFNWSMKWYSIILIHYAILFYCMIYPHISPTIYLAEAKPTKCLDIPLPKVFMWFLAHKSFLALLYH